MYNKYAGTYVDITKYLKKSYYLLLSKSTIRNK